MYGPILRRIRESKGLSQASVAKTVGISPAHLARLESGQRGLYLDDFVNIVEALGDKPGNLLPNDLGSIGRMKPLVDRLSAVDAKVLAHISAIVDRIIRLADEVATPPLTPGTRAASNPRSAAAPKRPRP